MTIPPLVRLRVLNRDKGCIAPLIDADCGECRGPLEFDHVRGRSPIGTLAKTRDGGFGKRPPHDEQHLVVLCNHHHQGSGWATSHRPALREWLREHEEAA